MFTAERASRRRTRNEVLQPVDGAGGRRIAVHGERQAVEEGILGVLDAAFKQVDNGLWTTILQFLQTGNGDRDGRLPDRIFRRREGLRRGDIQSLITAVPLAVCYFCDLRSVGGETASDFPLPLLVINSDIREVRLSIPLSRPSCLVVHAASDFSRLAPCRPRRDFQVNQRGFNDALSVVCVG